MVLFYFLLAGLSYSFMATLPFWTTKNKQLMLAILIGIVANSCWVLISRLIDKNDIPKFSLYFDVQLTLIYLLVPYFFIKFDLSTIQVVGILLILSGIILTHLK